MISDSSSVAPFRAVLLDDNADDRSHFLQLIRRHPAIDLVGEAADFQHALEILSTRRVDVLFLESEIGGQSVLESCSLIPPSVKLIFLTRSKDSAVKAFELEALDFLLKPLGSHRLSEAVRRLLRIEWKRFSEEEQPGPTSGVTLIPFERGRRGESLENIGLIQAFGNYSRVSLGGNRSEIVLRSLAKWQKILPMPPFLRVHRNALVHGGKVRQLEETGEGAVLHLTGVDEPVPVSRRCLSEVREVLFAGH